MCCFYGYCPSQHVLLRCGQHLRSNLHWCILAWEKSAHMLEFATPHCRLMKWDTAFASRTAFATSHCAPQGDPGALFCIALTEIGT